MDEIITVLKSPVFWIGTVVIGIFINYFSDYTKPLIDKLLSKLSTKWRNRTAAKKQAWNKRVQSLVGNKDAQEQERKDEFREKLDAIFSLIFCLLLAVVGSIMRYENPYSFMWFIITILYTGSYILFFKSMAYYVNAMNSQQAVLEARSIELQKETEALKAQSARLELEKSELEIEKRFLEKQLKTAR